MAETHRLHLLASEESDIRHAANAVIIGHLVSSVWLAVFLMEPLQPTCPVERGEIGIVHAHVADLKGKAFDVMRAENTYLKKVVVLWRFVRPLLNHDT